MDEEVVEEVKHIRRVDYFVIGLFMVSFYVGIIGQYTIMDQYIYDRFSKAFNFIRDNNTSCTNTNSNSSRIQNQIQSSTSQYIIYGQISSGISSIIVVIFAGPLSDLYGRKLIILCSWIGVFLASIVNILLVFLNAPMWIYIFGQFICGMGGNYGAMLIGVFSLISDSTTRRTRNLGIILIEFTLGVSLIISQLFLGMWLKFKHFSWPILVFGIIFSISGIILYFVKETRPKTSYGNVGVIFHIKISVRKIVQVFHIGQTCNILLIFCTIAFLIHVINFFGHFSLTTVYLFGVPFCWKSDALGRYRSITSGVVQFGTFLSYFLLKFNVNAIYIIEFGFLTSIVSKILFAISPLFPKSICDYLIYIASFDLFSGAAVSLLRSISSKLVSPNEYGSLFSMMSAVETFGSFSGGVIYSAIYNISFKWFYGFTYCVAVFILSVAFMIMILYYIVEKRTIKRGYQYIAT